jgi:hypothetical protein
MTLNDFFASALRQSLEMMKTTLADMSDADLMTRPAPGANHANWQVGHLVVAETRMLKAVGAPMPELPAGFADKYTKDTIASDDAAAFAKKDELLALMEKARAATIAFVQAFPAARFGEKGPMPFTPTMADLFEAQSGHALMHLGQIQVLRRKLGKPVLF